MNPPSFDKYQYIKEGRCESRKGGQLTPPVTLGIISTLLTENKVKNNFYDFMALPVSLKKFREIVKDYDLFIVSVSTPTFDFDKKVATIIKNENPKAKLVALGVISKALPEKVLEFYDISILGEPEYTTLEIARNNSLNNIKGIAYKQNNKIVYTKTRKHIENLDELPFPDRNVMPNHAYKNPRTGKPFTVIKIQRGCPYNCSFCTAPFYYGKKARYRSADNIVLEIKECIDKYGISDFLFLGDTFTLNHSFIKKLCNKIISKKFDIIWSCNSRIDTFNTDLAKIMKKAGCWFISFGVESGSKKIIKENSKNLDPKKAINVAKTCRNFGIKSMMYYILGFPNETREDMNKTIKLALEVESDFARFFVATPLPGSQLYEINSKTNFVHLNLSDINSNMSNLSNKELKSIIRKAYFNFYLRPSQIIRTVSTFSILNFLKASHNFIKAYL